MRGHGPENALTPTLSQRERGPCCSPGERGPRRFHLEEAILFAALMAIVLGAAALRLVDLGNRPMHCDEANQALKFGRLLEEGDYAYDPREHHGPSLNFLTLPVARLTSAQQLSEVTETHLRLVPAIFGIVLVGLVWLVRDELGHAAALCAAVLAAVSSAMVFYSRYYIHEMLLVCFTFGAMIALWRYARGVAPAATEETQPGRQSGLRQARWLVLLGVCLGMMHATKETCVIPLFAMAVAAVSTMGDLRRTGLKRIVLAGLVVLVTAASVSILLFSSFFDNPRGVIDSVTTYSHYLGRASGEGSAGRQVYPWDYYLRILFWWHRPGGPVWTEASIAVLALVGLAAAVFPRALKPAASLPFVRFLSIYTVLMTLIYSAMPYKTPWCALGFLHEMILLAGVGATVLVRAAPGYVLKTAMIGLLIAAAGHLGWEAHRASFRAYDDPDNPYVYAHTTSDVPLLAKRIQEIAAAHPDRRAVHVQVICPEDDYWPLPWYLRGFSRVGWYASFRSFQRPPQGPAAPLILTQPEMEPSLVKYLYEDQPPGKRCLYVPLAPDEEDHDWQLRPHVPLRVYVRLDLWEAYQATKREGALPQRPSL